MNDDSPGARSIRGCQDAATAKLRHPMNRIEGKRIVSNSTHARVKSYDNGDMTIEYLSLQDVANRLGVSRNSVAKYNLPEPDVRVGSGLNAIRGWAAGTIDDWNSKRPGPGRWGARAKAESKGSKE